MPQATLASLRVLLTRPQGHGNDEWADALRRVGAEPLHYPTLTIVPPESWEPVDAALARLADYDWVVLTSQTAVDFLARRMPGGRFPQTLRAQIAAVGPATARAIEEAGGAVALTPSDNRQEGLIEALRPVAPGRRVLLPIAAGARALLADTLRSWGCCVEVLPIYRVMPQEHLGQPPLFDCAVFASPSALRAYLALAGASSLARKIVAVVGKTTAREAEANGVHTTVAATPDIDALIRAIAEARSNRGEC